ncbi:hypothetical protein C343_01041 [Cryptococcus neoformans C23]|uniref:Uncharacterized protein n=1 Tax=Cryptococcus neoformans (strain H99 / ATCC 208821 / CBS 10515 / FGSC 9487) TaxID=235443 RepID=J9VFL8_CRYN9|nr:hypothetical protein CNAG_03647 [Cryptococcus neoformans var. grubii H99]AUB22655.1 hypothetical protein CKF44_03647 [Cryptococcus neoformans var. grubii]OWZ35374.1 hypothetical protein C347_01111 [Cryptococcus neoformans var. grubii AD2-60a]OWZ47253.1 hypothetical protein C343_01041 [Cryptococcus neoformans var. grubii C23]OWZ56835.1 hypothetical protein C368_01547 [Cryptococcus neoformans var. grubii 125.91]OXC86632.1 hypothetical protein C344_01049 [Cryptococcus neoformans var. grubii AD|eukprot:XP_012047363.1 hypothetical protein CNAG_03647 [Cryptococcus neoformans var. grubii H99]
MERTAILALRGTPNPFNALRPRSTLCSLPLFSRRASTTSTPRLPTTTGAHPVLRQRGPILQPRLPSATSWPWRQIPSSSPDMTILERTVFARPSDFSPPLLLFAAGVWGLFVISWYALPDPPKRELTEEEKVKIEARHAEAGFWLQLGDRVSGSVYSSAQPILMGGVSLILAGFLIASSTIATRITMVQMRPVNGSGEGKTFLKLTTVAHEMLKGMIKPREVRIEDCSAYFPSAERATTVRLRVLKPDGQPFKYTLDRFPYNLDFREIKEDYKVVDKEIVLSVPRLQQTFGAILKGKPNYAKIA